MIARASPRVTRAKAPSRSNSLQRDATPTMRVSETTTSGRPLLALSGLTLASQGRETGVESGAGRLSEVPRREADDVC